MLQINMNERRKKNNIIEKILNYCVLTLALLTFYYYDRKRINGTMTEKRHVIFNLIEN